MNAKRVILNVVCATALAGAVIWLSVGHQARLGLAEENKALRQQLSQLASLAAENERRSILVAQASRPQSLSDEQFRELLRLRGEVGVLRQQSKELDMLRESNRQLRAALENSLKTQGAAPTVAVATADYWPRDSWTFAGYATPDAALQSTFWAASKGDVKAFLGGVEREYESEASTKKAMAKFTTLKSVRVLNQEVQTDDTDLLTLAFQKENYTTTNKVLMKKIGNDWKVSGAD